MISRITLVITLMLVAISCFSQTNASDDLASHYLHPYFDLMLGLNGGGYGVLSSDNAAGIDLELPHLIATAEAEYDFVRKDNDGGPINPKGRQRTLETRIFYKTTSGFYFGVGGRWTELSTTNYSKSSNSGEAGIGNDFISHETPYSCRVEALYFQNFNEHVGFPNKNGCGEVCGNGGRGLMFHLVIPSPATNGWKVGPVQLFFDERLEAARFHNFEASTHAVDSWLTFGLIARF